MKLKLKDKVLVLRGRDHGKTGEIIAIFPKTNQVVVEGVNIAKRHTKPNAKQPKGGILEVTKPLSAAAVMVLDPSSGRPARIGYKVGTNGAKERVFKVSKFQNKKSKPAKQSDVKDEVKKKAAK